MKILCEVPLKVRQYEDSIFNWLPGFDNLLFIVENRRHLRVLSIDQDTPEEVRDLPFAETRQCTSISWNENLSMLAIVLEKKQIWLWDLHLNKLEQFKTRSMESSSSSGSNRLLSSVSSSVGSSSTNQAQRKVANKTIEFVAWSKLSNKLAICYTSGQILLCELDTTTLPLITGPKTSNNSKSSKSSSSTSSSGKRANADESKKAKVRREQKGGNNSQADDESHTTCWERFIDNSEAVLNQIVAIEVSEHAEIFACFSKTSEVLVMTFDGHIQFYSQLDPLWRFLCNAKFSPPRREHSARTGAYLGESICLAYQSAEKTISMKCISLSSQNQSQGSPIVSELPQQQKQIAKSKLIDYYWLSATHLLLCFSSGSIHMIQLNSSSLRSTAPADDLSEPEIGGKGSGASCNVYTELLRLDPHLSHKLTEQRSLVASPTLEEEEDDEEQEEEDQHQASSTSRSSSSRSTSSAPAVKSPSRATSPPNLARESSTMSIAEEDPTPFSIFEMIKVPKRLDSSSTSFALAAGTSYQLQYIEIFKDASAPCGFSVEHFDDNDLGESLQRANLKLERACWNRDCSMLSVQLTSGHLIIYRTRLQDYKLASHGARTVYLSSPNEVTILNLAPVEPQAVTAVAAAFAAEIRSQTSGDSGSTSQQQQHVARNDNALILNVDLRPSLLAIGPKHFALALNNRIRFYPLDSLGSSEASSSTHSAAAAAAPADAEQPTSLTALTPADYHEREYAAIVVAISLASRYVAVQFDDGRLKLHTLQTTKVSSDDKRANVELTENERFFPDPSQPEHISAFTLTEQLLVYATRELRLSIFCLKSWKTVQVCEHSKLFAEHIVKLKPNFRGNKFVCLLEPDDSGKQAPSSRVRRRVANTNTNPNTTTTTNAFVYDLYSNQICSSEQRNSSNPGGEEDNINSAWPGSLWLDLITRQLAITCGILPMSSTKVARLIRESRLLAERSQVMSNVIDAIWDTDGRTVLLIEPKAIHVLAVLDHTLEREETIVVYAASAKKPTSHTMLYASHGIVSYQTSLGRLINSELETHNEELKLAKLETKIKMIKIKYDRQVCTSSPTTTDDCDGDIYEDLCQSHMLEAHLKVVLLKASFLCTQLPIYPLPKCRDLCKYLLEDEALNLTQSYDKRLHNSDHKLVNQIIWKILAAWSLLTLNLDFASLIYRRCNLRVQSILLEELIRDIKGSGPNAARSVVKKRVIALLGGHEVLPDK